MVGVPGRSKGCNTCRQRRIACDQQKPQCKQCVKSNRLCEGYRRNRIFIHTHGTSSGGSRVHNKGYVCQMQRNETLEAEQHNSNSYFGGKNPRRGCPTRERPSQGVISKTVSPHLVYRQQLLSEFLLRYRLVSNPAACRYDTVEDRPAAWLRYLPDLLTRTKALELSILALSTVKLGHFNNDRSLVDNSLKLYVRGLSELQKALWDPDLTRKDETLAACMILSTYEVIECPAKTHQGWLSHLRGCSKLVQVRGPEAHASALGHELFLSFRLREITQAITERRSTYLADAKWMDLPWRDFPKTPFHKLLDIMVHLPSLIEQSYHMKGLASTERLLSSMKILKYCWKVDEDLHRFFEELEESSSGPLFWPKMAKEESPFVDKQGGKVFPIAFSFLNLRIANICMLYWASLIILWSSLSYVYTILATTESSEEALTEATACRESTSFDISGVDASGGLGRKSPMPISNSRQLRPLEVEEDVVSISRNICQSLEYCTQTEVLGLGPGMAYFPLKVAIETFHDHPNCTQEQLWAETAMQKVNNSGVRMLNHIGITLSQKAYMPI